MVKELVGAYINGWMDGWMDAYINAKKGEVEIWQMIHDCLVRMNY